MAEATSSTGPEGTPGTEGEKPAEVAEGTKPAETEFEGEYDAARAKRKIDAQKADLDKAREKLAAFEKAENDRQTAEMSDLQKAVARAEKAEADLAEHTKTKLRDTIAAEHEVPAALLTGDDEETLIAQAKALADFAGKKPAEKPAAPGTKPKAVLTPGSGGESPNSPDIDGIAARIRRR
ncbi:hypothetical protein [Kribbella sp. CA-293567]|uniref:hypothetical protein n=1 Tax=Kribbella sp. CA-293567 TaxID=3002436 RepID=UPI0022DD3C90|nr:hypothetical protein [Kribbella sp. CA-293567]WBQ03781.1 hypothetical protein OX958_27905 [Kribbella sp. CA-293567]